MSKDNSLKRIQNDSVTPVKVKEPLLHLQTPKDKRHIKINNHVPVTGKKLKVNSVDLSTKTLDTRRNKSPFQKNYNDYNMP